MKKYVVPSVLLATVALLGPIAAMANDEPVAPIEAPVVVEIVIHPYEAEFFAVERTNPYSEAELEHEPNQSEIDGIPWHSRVSSCISLPSYAEYEDCMWRPWRYGY